MRFLRERNFIFIVGMAAALHFGTPAKDCSAGGPVQGARSAGMGTAFIGVADDPSAIAVNPAGLSWCPGTQLYAGVTAVSPSTKYKSPTGDDENTLSRTYFPPYVHISSQLGDGTWTLGLGLCSLFGIGGLAWPDDGITRYISTESTIATLHANPTLAWRVFPRLSVALGGAYMYSRNFSEARIDQAMVGAKDGEVEVEADGGGVGFNLGLRYQPLERLGIGLSYRSPIEINHHGHMTFTNLAPALQPLTGGPRFQTDVSTTLDFPEIYGVGLSWRQNPGWVLALDVERVGWSCVQRMDLDLEDEIAAVGITDQIQIRNWEDVWLFKLGMEYQLKRNLSLRCGYAYCDTPVPEETLTPANPDAVQHLISLGLGYRLGPLSVDFFYGYGYYESREVSNSVLSGTYETTTSYAGIGLRYVFPSPDTP